MPNQKVQVQEKTYFSLAKPVKFLWKYSVVFKTLITFSVRNFHLTALCQHPEKAELADSHGKILPSKTSVSIVSSYSWRRRKTRWNSSVFLKLGRGYLICVSPLRWSWYPWLTGWNSQARKVDSPVENARYSARNWSTCESSAERSLGCTAREMRGWFLVWVLAAVLALLKCRQVCYWFQSGQRKISSLALTVWSSRFGNVG